MAWNKTKGDKVTLIERLSQSLRVDESNLIDFIRILLKWKRNKYLINL